MAASPTSTAIQKLILNTAFLASGDTGPLLDNLDTFTPAPPWRRVSGDTAPLRVVLVDDQGTVPTTPRRVILADGNTLHLTAKRNPADVDLALSLDFTQGGSEGSEYYEADPGTLAVDTDIFNGEPFVLLSVDFQEKNDGGDILRQWRGSLYLLWSTSSGGSPTPIYYVGYFSQSATSEQKAFARANIGAGTSNFDPASPGPIGETTPDAGTFTTLTVGGSNVTFGTFGASFVQSESSSDGLDSLGLGTTDVPTFGGVSIGVPSGDANTALSQDGTILSVENGAPIGASSVSGVARVLTQSEVVAFISNSSPTFTGITTTNSADNGQTVIGSASATNFIQQWKDFSGTVVAGVGIDGALTGASVTVSDEVRGGSLTTTGDEFNVQGDGSFSAASGAFSVDVNGNATATHFKAQGSDGVAGHVVLSQGTTPNGTGSTTTLWGIDNGVGWRNGIGTAYILTLPTASGTLALVGGNLGTPTTLTLTNATGLQIAGGGTGASTAAAARENLGLTRMSNVSVSDAAWVTSTVSGTVAVNTYSTGSRTGQIATATAGFGRFYLNVSNTCNIITAARTTINWSSSFRMAFRALIYVNANTSSKVTGLVATATATAAHDLAALGLGIQAYGNGSACRIRLQAHNGSSATNGTDVAWTASDDNFYDFELHWTAGTGATLYKDGVSLCSVSTGLPSGNGAGGATCPMWLFENGSGASDATTIRLLSLAFRRG